MKQCHSRSIEIIKMILGGVVPRALFRALDVAGGDGRFATSFLLKSYRHVDLFDQCPKAVGLAKRAMKNHSAFGYAEQATMQDFRWRFQYSAIFMVWCAGYLARPDLVKFLKRAKASLMVDEGRNTRQSEQESFIFLLDNVLARRERA